MTDNDFELGADNTNPRIDSDDVSSLENTNPSLNSASVNFKTDSGVENVSDEGNDVNNDSRPENDEVVVRDRDVKSVKKKGKKRMESKTDLLPVYDSMISQFDEFAAKNGVVIISEERSPGGLGEGLTGGHGFEVGDMVWGKVKSHPWWPGHIFSEDFATPSVRRSKRDGLLLVAFFGDSSYGWFDPSELVPFDTDFEEKCRQTNAKSFVKAVEEAVDELSRRSALGLACMCRSKENFRQTDVKGYFAVDVPDYEPGAVYSVDAIGKAREGFKPDLALDFIRRLALEPTGGESTGIEFIKNKANVVSYRRAVYEEFDDTYLQAFGYDTARSSPETSKEPAPRKTPAKAPLSGRQVFADTSGKGKSSTKPNKPKDHAKKDKYLLKRRDEPKQVKGNQKEKGKVALSPQLGHIEDSTTIAAGDFVLQKRVSAAHGSVGLDIANDGTPLVDISEKGAIMEDKPMDLESEEPGFQTINSNVDNDDKRIVSQMEDKNTSSDLVDDKTSSDKLVITHKDIRNSGAQKDIASQSADKGLKKVKVSKRPFGELGAGKSVLPEKKKRKKERLMSDGTQGAPLMKKVLTKKHVQSTNPMVEIPHGTDSKSTISSSSHTGTQETTGLANYETELPQVLGDLHSLALDPFQVLSRGRVAKTRQVFLKFRSLVFQKSLNLSAPAEDDSSKSFENGIGVTHVKLQASSSGKPDDPTKGGRKRGPSDRQEEMAAKKKKKLGDIRNLTKEKKAVKKNDEPPTRDVKPPVTMIKKSGPDFVKKTERRPEPTMLNMKFPPGGSLPNTNELKARFARFGVMDHSATRIFWNTFTCRVVYRYKADAQAAYKFAVGNSTLFGNRGVKCTLKEVGVVGSAEPEPSAKVPKEDHQPSMEYRPPSMVPASPGVQLKSILKKSGSEDAAGNGGRGRVKFMLGGEENQVKNMENKNGASSFSSSTSHATMDFNSKNFQKAVLQSSTNPLPLLPLPNSNPITSSTTQFTRPLPPPPPPSSKHYSTPLAPPPLLPPPRSINYANEMSKPTPTPPLLPPPGNFVHNLQRPNIAPIPTMPKIDISQQMLSLLTKCNEVVTNVSNTFGYVPYHPL
uniref:uncharacterized protein LOC122584228 n=1 Tax=Erigeron canadensis TaxID=72917 RepID=UPI001CB92A74|nr:uncharacterized protein LOC122584228 [Erigeron canadensis]XP_043612381.1 uncharacterized protein LOC122584228 [Erigeron canadensis]